MNPNENKNAISNLAAPVDLEIRVTVQQLDGGIVLEYVLHSPSGVVPFNHRTIRGKPIGSSSEAFHASLIKQLDNMHAGFDIDHDMLLRSEIDSELISLGHNLYHQLFPPAMRAAYRSFRDEVDTLQITADEPWIPWELIKPYEDSDSEEIIDDDFLCVRFQLTRWLKGDVAPAAAIHVGRLACIDAGEVPKSRPLPFASKERELLSDLARAHPDIEDASISSATFGDLETLLRRGGLGLLHFLGYTDFSADSPAESRFLLADRPFRPRHLHGPTQTQLKLERPLIFLNASYAARSGWALNRLGGWTDAWIRRCGCGGFIGPHWIIDDAGAYQFAETFYQALARGETFGRAAQAARQRVRDRFPGSLSWLAYGVYAHPNGRLILGRASNVIAQVGRTSGAANDQVAVEDQLGFKHYVAAFADLIESIHTQPPLTIGIFGAWGMGKSFLLEHISREIERRHEKRRNISKRRRVRSSKPWVHVVKFNAWEYSANEAIWPGLVRKIMDRLENEVTWRFTGPFFMRFRRNLRRQLRNDRGRIVLIGYLLAVGAGFLLWQTYFDLRLVRDVFLILTAGGLLKIISNLVSNPISKWITNLFRQEDYGRHIGYMTEIRADLEFLEKRLRADKGRIFVAIDDLDRCEPDRAVEMLQAIKLLLDFKSFIVCLGIDSRVITRAVEKHYQGLLGQAGVSGYEYLDKIVQIPFCIPIPTKIEVARFMASQLGKPRSQSGEAFSALEPSEVEESKAAEEPPGEIKVVQSDELPDERVTNAGERAIAGEEDAAFTVVEHRAFNELIPYLKYNPRHLKRVVNVYRLVRALAYQKSEEAILRKPAAVIHWIVLCAQWPYTAHVMLLHLDEIQRHSDEQREIIPEDDPLPFLLNEVESRMHGQTRGQLDYEPEVLQQLLAEAKIARLNLEELQILRQYTVHFNPAIEAEPLESSAPTPADDQ